MITDHELTFIISRLTTPDLKLAVDRDQNLKKLKGLSGSNFAELNLTEPSTIYKLCISVADIDIFIMIFCY